MISVIVPVYNVENYLKRCVDSVLAQTYANLEIILVDDGSPDRSGIMCDEYAEKDSRIKVVHKQNGGLSSARNAGLNVATGKYIAFIDSDDWVDENYILNLKIALEDNNADMACCMFCRANESLKKRQFFDTNVEIVTNEKYYCILTEKSFAGYATNKLFKRDIIENNKLRFDTKIFNGEDFPFVLEYAFYVNQIAYLRQDLYYYFFRQTGIMNNIKLSSRFLTIIYAREKALNFLSKNGIEDGYHLCLASYLSILCKIKFMAMANLEKYGEVYNEVETKIKNNKKGLFKLKRVSLKDKFKLFLMIRFPKTSAKLYQKKIKV